MRSKAAIIAGGGLLPTLIAEGMNKLGVNPIILLSTLEKERNTDYKKLEESYVVKFFELGELERLTNYLLDEEIDEVIMAGKFSKTDFLNFNADKVWLNILSKIPNFQNDSVLAALIEHFEENKITVSSQGKYLCDLVAPEGNIVGEITPIEIDDILYGYTHAKKIADLDIGQTIVVKDKTVFAVEAIDGTNATIKRGGELAKHGAIAIKVSKTKLDWRVDVPVIGAETIKAAIEGNIRVLCVEAGKAFFVEKEESFRLANTHGLSIYGVTKV